MIKELLISTIIVVIIFIGNCITENYTKQSVEEAINDLSELREELIKQDDDINIDIAKERINNVHDKWDSRYKKLVYYIEHDELEKVETELTGLKGYIEKEEYTEAIPELDKSVFILEHIKDKTSFKLKNIF